MNVFTQRSASTIARPTNLERAGLMGVTRPVPVAMKVATSPVYPASNCSVTNLPGRCCPAVICNNPTLGGYSPTPEITAVPPKNLFATPTPGSRPAPPSQVWIVPGTTGISGNNPSLPGGGYPVPSKLTDYSGLRGKIHRCLVGTDIGNHFLPLKPVLS
ncbi:hypothetical protein PoB_005027100 [Plakobranchus ocellatus]|uniref:Uncharacterized protein n=1 Tax=Plakobranchus ocellatus TaxID=259542 RepID=A0AAV4BTH6_9GAST|nr:hypothetical protein PoB_005027100 [Plakobranchus ocellatus]